MKKITLNYWIIAVLICSVAFTTETSTSNKVEITPTVSREAFEKMQAELTVFLAKNLTLGSMMTDGVFTGKVETLFYEVLNKRNSLTSKDRARLLKILSALEREYGEEEAGDSIDMRRMILEETFLNLIRSMLEPKERTAIMNKVKNQYVSEYVQYQYDLGFLDYKLMIDLFDILTTPYDSKVIENKINPYDSKVIENKINDLSEFIEKNNLTVEDEESVYLIINNGNCYIHPEIPNFINRLKKLINKQ